MENKDDLLLSKQELLKAEIIDKNYDREAFLDFCIAKKENGDDLNTWTIDELKEAIDEFAKTHIIEQIKHNDENINNNINNINIKEQKDQDEKISVEKINKDIENMNDCVNNIVFIKN
jgi:hypothetical protein